MNCIFCNVECKEIRYHLDCFDTEIEKNFGIDVMNYLYENSKALNRKDQIPEWTESVLRQGVGEGKRNKMLFVLFSTLKKCNTQDEEIKRRLIEFNKKCRPPLPDKEIDYHVRYLTRRFSR